jgi:daunorubicin resistance ABC transporter ATP-binding subunit
MDDPIIDVRQAVKHFRGVRALDGLTLSIPAGVVYGLLGPNGAGKTTLIRILATLLRLDSGRATVAGHDVTTDSRAVRERIGLAGQHTAVDGHLTGRENIAQFGRLSGLSHRVTRARTDDLLERIGLTDAADRPTRTYSGGMLRRVDLAASLIARPQVLFLDEPTTGIDPASRREVWQLIRDLAADGTTVLLTTQYLDEADQLADDIAVIDRGGLIAQGTPTQLKDHTGSAVIHIQVPARHATQALRLLQPLSAGYDPGHERIVIAATDGTNTLQDVLTRLGRAGITPTDVALHRPTLDDVFLALTRPADRVAAGAMS